MAEDFGIIQTVFQETSVGGAQFVFGLVALIIACALVTKEVGKWKKMAFPMVILLHLIGVTQSFATFGVTAVLYAQEHLSVETIGSIASGVSQSIRRAPKKRSKPKKDKDGKNYVVIQN